jgi:hypothetical protein
MAIAGPNMAAPIQSAHAADKTLLACVKMPADKNAAAAILPVPGAPVFKIRSSFANLRMLDHGVIFPAAGHDSRRTSCLKTATQSLGSIPATLPASASGTETAPGD